MVSGESEGFKAVCSVRSACQLGDEALLKKLLAQGERSDDQDESGSTPLHEAAVKNHVACLQILLQYDAAMINWGDNGGRTALFKACSRGHIETVCLLLSFGGDPNQYTSETYFKHTPFMTALRMRGFNCAPLLFQHGGNVNDQNIYGHTMLHNAAGQGKLDIARWLLAHGARVDIRDYKGNTPIYYAALRRHSEVLKSLLQQATIELINDAQCEHGRTPLNAAALGGNPACVMLLLENGANANIRTQSTRYRNRLAISYAIRRRTLQMDEQRRSDYYKCVEMLLNSLSSETLDDFRKKECGEIEYSLLHHAVEYKNLEVVDLLLSKELNANIVAYIYDTICNDISKLTPLNLAARSGNLHMMQKLIEAGSEVHYCKNNVIPALRDAVYSKKPDAVKLLVKLGAVRSCASCISNLRAALLAISLNTVSVLDLLLKSGVNLNACWEDDSSDLNEVTLLADLTRGFSTSAAKYRAVFAVLVDHITYTNCNNLLRKLAAHFQDDDVIVGCLQSILRTPHSLQHLCRLIVRSQAPLDGHSFETVFRRNGDTPETVCKYLLFEY